MHGIFMNGMLYEQAQTISAHGAAARHAAQTAAAAKSDVTEMREQLERMALLNQALWELVSERLNISEADLENKAQEVDMRDGKADGRMSQHPLRCPQCGRVSNSRHRKCLYCGMLFDGAVFG